MRHALGSGTEGRAQPCLPAGPGTARGGVAGGMSAPPRSSSSRFSVFPFQLLRSLSWPLAPPQGPLLERPGSRQTREGKLSSPCGLEISEALGLGRTQNGRGWHCREKDLGLLGAGRRGPEPEVAAFLRPEITQTIYGAVVLTTLYALSSFIGATALRSAL